MHKTIARLRAPAGVLAYLDKTFPGGVGRSVRGILTGWAIRLVLAAALVVAATQYGAPAANLATFVFWSFMGGVSGLGFVTALLLFLVVVTDTEWDLGASHARALHRPLSRFLDAAIYCAWAFWYAATGHPVKAAAVLVLWAILSASIWWIRLMILERFKSDAEAQG